ncbi:MAG: hypothetical protein R2932_59875 [Caldilineaceae bacterium]
MPPSKLHADWPDEDPNRGFFIAAVPESTAVQQASIVSSGESYGEITASNNVPTVQMVYPNGGENLTAPTITLRWDAADADGDALSYLVQYSRDNGVTWQTWPSIGRRPNLRLHLAIWAKPPRA